MRERMSSRFRLIFASLCGFVLVGTASQASPAGGEPRTQMTAALGKTAKPVKVRKVPGTASNRYFVEFRSRYALSYGHTFLAHGRLNGRGEIVESEVAGLHPAGDSPVPWMIGHVVPVVSETGPSDGDLEEKYVSARYRVELDEQQYGRVLDKIRQLQASSPVWHAVFYNCSAFVSDVAHFMGLKTPVPWLYPETFINTMREMNSTARSDPTSEPG